MRRSDATARVRGRGNVVGRVLFALGSGIVLTLAGLLFWVAQLPLGALTSAAPASAAMAAANAADERPMEITNLIGEIDRPDPPTREEQKREEAKKKQENDVKPPGQVVDIAKPAIEQSPDDARFSAEYDSKVDREKRGPTGRDKAGAKTPPVAAAAPSQPAPAVQGGAGGRQGTEGEPNPVVARVQPSPGRDGLPEDEDGHMLKRMGSGRSEPRTSAAPSPASTGQGGDGGDGREAARPSPGSAPAPNLAPSREMLDRAIGAGKGSMDYLKDLEDGDSTALNAKKWKFASFFNRIKRAVAQEWHPDVVYVRHDPSGNVYGVKDRVSVLRVHLTPDGKLAGTNVLNSSGVDFLDDEAADAFRKAGPFANPPKELVEADGQIHFTFAFIFELSGRTSLKVYKYK